MEDAPQFLKDVPKEVITKDALDELNKFVINYLSYEEDIEASELVLKALKKEFNKISQEKIPGLLTAYGLSEIKLATGEKVIVKEDASVSVPKEKQSDFYNFLHDRDEEDIIKLHFHFDRMPVEKMTKLFEFLTKEDYAYESERGVHSQTLKKYFKELLGIGISEEERSIGISDGTFLRKEEVVNIANVFTFFNTKIK